MSKKNSRQKAERATGPASTPEGLVNAVLPGARVNERYARPLFILTIVTGSFLLFLTQPMIARMALPRVGGAPSVWNSAMLVYQLLLLAGYAYAHWVVRLKPRKQAGLHIILLGVAALWLPIGLTAAVPPSDFEPALWVPWFLLASIGPVFFIVSAQAPLMQRWYALETSRGDPYPLYAASNLGSFAGLISYPLLVEPLMTLQQQSWLWTAMYAFLVLLVIACALTVPANAVEVVPEHSEPAPTMKRTWHWIVLAAIPSGLMLSTTTHLTTDIVALPMIWVLPLGLYLLSFVIAFAVRRKVADFITMLAPIVILVAGGLVFGRGASNPLYPATLGLLLLFAIAVALHSEMFRLRPAASHLTRFYLAMSVGGMLGGLFCAIVAPLIFDWAYEYPLLILAAALLVPQMPLVPWPRGLEWMMRLALPLIALLMAAAIYMIRYNGIEPGSVLNDTRVVLVGSILISLTALACLGRRIAFAICLLALMISYDNRAVLKTTFVDGGRTRSYFGIYEVKNDTDLTGRPVRILTHGTTLHGKQNMTPEIEREPTTYYARRSGVGIALQNADSMFGPRPRIGVVGLGSGTLSCYAFPNQSWTFFEIDPAMVEVARNQFTFMRRCAPQARVIVGDARLSLRDPARVPDNSIDVLAVDAFSSDAVPMHLLTREALQVYGRGVQPNGLVLFHISNRYLNLEPVIAQLAQSSGWHASVLVYQPTEEEEANNATISVWVALTRNPDTLRRLMQLSGNDATAWRSLTPRPGFVGWTDDYASILPILNLESFLPRSE